MEQKSTYGLIGYPVNHSLSPLMHNAAFEALGVEAVYELFSLEEQELDEFFVDLKTEESHIFGLNVTVPYKEKVVKYLDSLAPFAKKVNAVNTIVISKDRKLVGYNTDGPGFLAHLSELGFDVKGKRVSILGAGGASRAIISSLCVKDERPGSIRIYDIDKDKAEFLISDLRERFDVSIVETVNSIDDLNVELADMLINATPLGMKEDDPFIIDEESLHPNMFVYDLVYNPAETYLLKIAKEKGAQTANGLGMLFYQGVLAFQHWADIQLEQEVKDIMRSGLEAGASPQK
ncbi:MAG: shikimate dehydrogenase [Candidatus Omnitrophica bacterium]|nr:shikimate dehydrogenase [Candidatus Omnitrophota bacterium]